MDDEAVEGHAAAQQAALVRLEPNPGTYRAGGFALGGAYSLEEIDRFRVVSPMVTLVRRIRHSPVVRAIGFQQLRQQFQGQVFAAEEIDAKGLTIADEDESRRAAGNPSHDFSTQLFELLVAPIGL
jgi:hypothetical protein